MKIYRTITTHAALMLLAAGAFAIPKTVIAAQTEDSAEVRQLLEDAQEEAISIKTDSASLESFTRSKLSWQTYAKKLDSMKEHINNTGALLTELRNAEAEGSEWQQTAIKRIEPLLKEMADNTTATIRHLNDNQGKVHMAEFQGLVKANYAAAVDLEGLIRDYVNFADAKEEFERLSSELAIGSENPVGVSKWPGTRFDTPFLVPTTAVPEIPRNTSGDYDETT